MCIGESHDTQVGAPRELPKVEMDGNEAHKGLETTSRGHTKCTHNPDSSPMLHLCEVLNGAFVMGALEVPHAEPICCNGQHTSMI